MIAVSLRGSLDLSLPCPLLFPFCLLPCHFPSIPLRVIHRLTRSLEEEGRRRVVVVATAHFALLVAHDPVMRPCRPGLPATKLVFLIRRVHSSSFASKDLSSFIFSAYAPRPDFRPQATAVGVTEAAP